MDARAPGRANQRRRTRKDLLEAAGRLLKDGRTPSLEEVAEAALVSRATAYRYFPSIEALLREAALDVQPPAPTELFADEADAALLGRHERRHDAVGQVARGAQQPRSVGREPDRRATGSDRGRQVGGIAEQAVERGALRPLEHGAHHREGVECPAGASRRGLERHGVGLVLTHV